MTAPQRVDALLREARARGVARLDAELLAAHVLGLDRAAIIARPERPLEAGDAERLARLVAQRARGVPFAHLVGFREFHGLRLAVNADVLVPRPDTEILVDAVLAALDDAPRRVVDLGTGSGAVALALARARPAWHVLATDRSEAALRTARGNAVQLGLSDHVRFRAGDWYGALAGEAPLDAIVSNPPYVAEADAELAADVRAHEPHDALFAGADGLDALRLLIRGAPGRLAPGGLIALEHGHRQAPAVRALLQTAGFTVLGTHHDLADRPRATLGRLARVPVPVRDPDPLPKETTPPEDAR